LRYINIMCALRARVRGSNSLVALCREMQVGYVGYRVFVLKVSKLEETFYYVCSRAGNNLGDGIPKNLHEEVEGRGLTPQLDRCPDRVFRRRGSAKKAVRKICNKLRHQGFVVNPWEPVYSFMSLS
jgi:hypothetical protein